MSNNDGAALAQCISVGEELSRLMVQTEYLREENARLREALRPFAEKSTDCNSDYEWLVVKRDDCDKARAALEGEDKE